MCVKPMPLKKRWFLSLLCPVTGYMRLSLFDVSVQSTPCPASSPIDLRPLDLLDLGHMRLQLLVLVRLL